MKFDNSVIPQTNSSYKWWILGVVMFGTFMAVLDTTIVNVALPTIIAHFHSSLSLGEWVVTGYLLSMALMLPTSGYIANRFGFKRIYFLGMVVFTLGSLACSLSTSLEMLVAARIFEGFGSGLVQPLGMAIIAREFDAKQRGLALGFWAVAVAASVSLGPFFGGYLVEHYAWHTIFDVNIPIGIFALLAIYLIQREFKVNNAPGFDSVSFLLLALWLPLSLWALSHGSSPLYGGWDSPEVVGALIISISAFGVFVWHSLTTAAPLVDLRVLKDRRFAASMVIMFLFGAGLFGGNFLLPLYLQHSLDYTAYAAGAVFLPVGIIQGLLGPVSGYLGRKIGNKVLIIGGLLILVSYFLVSSTFDAHTPYWLIMLSVYLRGLGMGMSFTPLNALSLEGLSSEQMAAASGISNTIRQFAGSLGIAIFTSILLTHSRQTPVGGYIQAVDQNYMIAAIITALALIPLLMMMRKK